MADRNQLHDFLAELLAREDLEITDRAVARLRGFRFEWLDDLLPEDRLLIVTAFQAGLTGHEPYGFRQGAARGTNRAPRRIEAEDVTSGIEALARMIANRGIEFFAPETQQMILSCDCWPSSDETPEQTPG